MEDFLLKVLMICLVVVLGMGCYFLYMKQADPRNRRRGLNRNRNSVYMPQSFNQFRAPVNHHRPAKENIKTKVMPFMMLEIQTSKGIRSIPLVDNGSGFYIGSSEKCDLVIPKSESEFVGREHAYIYHDESSNTFILEDLNSLNGVYAVQENGQIQKVSQIELQSDMQFYIADVSVIIKKNNPFACNFHQSVFSPAGNFEATMSNFQKV